MIAQYIATAVDHTTDHVHAQSVFYEKLDEMMSKAVRRMSLVLCGQYKCNSNFFEKALQKLANVQDQCG